MVPLIDSHCHLDCLDLKPLGGRFEAFMEQAREEGLVHMLCVAINPDRYPKMRALVDPYPEEISVTVGCHPNDFRGVYVSPERLLEQARGDERVVAIGETGLDYYRSQGDLEWQRQRFRDHIAVARELKLPLVIHCRQAKEDVLRILREEKAAEVGGVFHCFAEDWETAKAVLDLGFYISFSGIVTFKNAETLREVARKVPEDRFLIETDSPYLAPVPMRGKPNYPYYVRFTAEKLAELRRTTLERVGECALNNFHALFSRTRRLSPESSTATA